MSDTNEDLYCLANVGVLDYDVSEKAELSLDKHTHGKKGLLMHTFLVQALYEFSTNFSLSVMRRS